MQILIAATEDFVFTETTKFSADEAVGQTELSCDNASQFSADDYVMLGNLGNDTTEMNQISSVGSDLKTIILKTATKHVHVEGALITKMLFNQRKFYRSSSESGTYTHLSTEGSPIDIEVDGPNGTLLEDSTGTPTSWYKATHYNSTTSVETALADAIATKAGEAEHYTSIYKIKSESGFKDNPYIGSDLVDRYRTEAEAQAEGAVIGVYSLPFSSTPKIFQHIVTLLSAGLLLSKEYGMEADVEISKTGQRKIERAEELLEKIRDSKILLVGEDGSELSKRTDVMASNSNAYSSDAEDKGELFNLSDEAFKLTDPAKPLSDSRRSSVKDTGFN